MVLYYDFNWNKPEDVGPTGLSENQTMFSGVQYAIRQKYQASSFSETLLLSLQKYSFENRLIRSAFVSMRITI